MISKRILKKLFLLNVPKSLLMTSILTLPIVIYLSQSPLNYNLAKTFADFAMVYFIIAFSLYLFLYGISHLSKSEARRKLVTFTRIYIRFHIAVAIIGTILITIHAVLMLSMIPLNNVHAITGLLTLLSLIGVLMTGYLRKRKSSGKRRRFHRYLSFLFIVLLIIHAMI